MSKVHMLRAFVSQRLSAAAEEIFELFERTIAEYEEQLFQSKENQRKILDTVFNPEVRLNRTDVQHLLVSKEDFPIEQQAWSSSLHHEDTPDPSLIKEEQEEQWTSQEGEQLQELEEVDITKSLFTPVPESKIEEPQPSQLYHTGTEESTDAEHLKTDADGEDCGRLEPDGNFNPDTHLQHLPHADISISSESENGDSGLYWGETSEPQSGSNSLQNNDEPVGDFDCNTGKSFTVCPQTARRFGQRKQLQENTGIQKDLKSFSCSICGKQYSREISLTHHMRRHSEGSCFTCAVCKKSFSWKAELVRHMRIHTGEKPFSCSVCGMRFTQRIHLTSHLRVHTGEKPFTCALCSAGFTHKKYLLSHMKFHAGKPPFSFSVCG